MYNDFVGCCKNRCDRAGQYNFQCFHKSFHHNRTSNQESISVWGGVPQAGVQDLWGKYLSAGLSTPDWVRQATFYSLKGHIHNLSIIFISSHGTARGLPVTTRGSVLEVEYCVPNISPPRWLTTTHGDYVSWTMTISIEESSDAELSCGGGMMLQWTIDTHHKEDYKEQSLLCFYWFIVIFYSRVNINPRVISDCVFVFQVLCTGVFIL